MSARQSKLLRKQAAMRRVVLALLPCVAGGVYYFGWRSGALATTSSTPPSPAVASSTFAFPMLGTGPVPPALPAVMGGGFLFGAFFMVTDPVSSPSTHWGRIAYAALIATCTLTIRNFRPKTPCPAPWMPW
jgi:Na+-translocating ferredoxin:NAD+ oxidoreductase RnfD subunit